MKTLRALLFASLAVAFAAPRTFAQTGTIAGVVVNATTHEPIEGVIISVEGTAYGAISRVNGAFAILGVPPGTYDVAARRVGFATRAFTGLEV